MFVEPVVALPHAEAVPDALEAVLYGFFQPSPVKWLTKAVATDEASPPVTEEQAKL